MQPSPSMRVQSVNIGVPREVLWKGRRVLTSIFKEPVAGRVAVRRLNLEGDQQADLTVPGGPEKAIYVYPADYYAFWREQYPEMELPWGMFGENLTIWGLRDNAVFIGDQLRVGTARLVVTQPRMPCYKLGIKFGRPDVLKRLFQSGKSGFYCTVSQEGEVAAGDPVTLLHRDADELSVRDILHLEGGGYYDVDLLRQAVSVEALPQDVRDRLAQRLENIAGEAS